MAGQDWNDAPQIHPSEIRVGDVIAALDAAHPGYQVKMISGPQTGRQRWTFFGRDDRGQQYTDTYGEDQRVRRYAKAS